MASLELVDVDDDDAKVTVLVVNTTEGLLVEELLGVVLMVTVTTASGLALVVDAEEGLAVVAPAPPRPNERV